MGLLWHFVNLTEEQKHLRRELLDRYANIAQASVILPLALVQCYFLACWIEERWKRERELDIPGSPYLKEQKVRRAAWSWEGVDVLVRRSIWWAGEKFEVRGWLVATRGEFLGAAIWAAWLLVCCTAQTGDDYLHLTKRFGIVAASQLPLHYALSLKSPLSPLQLLTGASWETLNRLHQLLGRITTFLLYGHAALYLNFYVQSGLLQKRLRDRDVILGLVGIVSFTAVGTTALSFIRKMNYRVFFVTHVTLATILLPVLFFHVHNIRIYIYEVLAIYLIHNILRLLTAKKLSGCMRVVPGTDLLDIRISTRSQTKIWKSCPGQHVYLSLAGHALSRTFKANPFTIASLHPGDKEIRLIARVLDGNTRLLASSANGNAKSDRPIQLTVEGPYGLPTHSESLLRYSRVLFVAGGVGATFVLPIYRALLGDLSPSRGSYRRGKVSFVWAVRDLAETRWAIGPADDDQTNSTGETELQEGSDTTGLGVKELRGIKERMQIYVTGDKSLSGGSSTSRKEGGLGASMEEDEESVELEQLLPAASAPATSSPSQKGTNLEHDSGVPDGELEHGQGKDMPELTVHNGRPDLRAIVQETFIYPGESVAVFVCGPKGMARTLRQEVGRYVNLGRELWFWNEEFGL